MGAAPAEAREHEICMAFSILVLFLELWLTTHGQPSETFELFIKKIRLRFRNSQKTSWRLPARAELDSRPKRDPKHGVWYPVSQLPMSQQTMDV